MSSNSCSAPSRYSVKHVGTPLTTSHRVYLTDSDASRILSPFHDVPLRASPASGSAGGNDDSRYIVNMLVEIPRFGSAKMEVSKDEWMNPIKQDIKKGALRYVKNCFPHRGYPWNYGALPQTWESPEIVDKHTGFKGDNDPIDAIEVGTRTASVGQVKQVKVLGAIGLLDEGETDWKIVVVDTTDPLSERLHDAPDLDRVCPGLLEATLHWFRVYKIPDGKPENQFALNGQVKGRDFAVEIVEETHRVWKDLIAGRIPAKKEGSYGISVANATLHDSPSYEAEPSVQVEGAEKISVDVSSPAPTDVYYV